MPRLDGTQARLFLLRRITIEVANQLAPMLAAKGMLAGPQETIS
jgi:hypothetical protein